MRTRGRAGAAIAVIAAAMLLSLPAAAGAQASLPAAPGISPPGANDWSCRPTAQRPVPVILVHGTFADMTVSWNSLSPLLKRDGFCVFALDYGRRATAPMEQSADEVAAFARKVLDATGAARVSFVGHSQGGSLSRMVVRQRGLLDRTDDVIGLAPSSHGTTTPGAPVAAQLGCASCADQMAGSPVMQRLNAPPEAPEPVSWTVVSTRYDEVVTPYRSQALAGGSVTNVVLQDRCPADPIEHVTIVGDPVALQWTLNALRRPGPANPAFEPDCTGRTLGHDPATPGTARRSGLRPRLYVVTRRTTARRHHVPVRVRCAGPSGDRCKGLLRLRRGGRTLAARRVSLATNGRARMRLRLTAAGRRALRRHRVVVATAGGQVVRVRRA